jgi:hypothetical protein
MCRLQGKDREGYELLQSRDVCLPRETQRPLHLMQVRVRLFFARNDLEEYRRGQQSCQIGPSLATAGGKQRRLS